MASPKDLQDVNHIKPREIIPLIKNGGVACVVDVDAKDTELYLSANTAVFERAQNPLPQSEEKPYSFLVEEEVHAEFLKHIEELKLKKAELLIELSKRVSALLEVQGPDLKASLKKEIVKRAALIKECDECIALVKKRVLERDKLSLTIAALEQNPDHNLVRFAPAKIAPSTLSQNRHTFFGAHRKAEPLPTPIDGLEPPTCRN